VPLFPAAAAIGTKWFGMVSASAWPLVSFRFISFHCVSLRFISLRFISFRFVSFRFVSFRLRYTSICRGVVAPEALASARKDPNSESTGSQISTSL